MALSLAGIPTIGLAGSNGGGHDVGLKREQKRIELHPVLKQSISWQGRDVIVMMDNDIVTNRNVKSGEGLVATVLAAAGARVYLAPTPVLRIGEKLGPDDFLMRVGDDKVLEHLAAATRWVPSPAKRINPYPSATFTPHRYNDIAQFLNGNLLKDIRYGVRATYRWYRRGFPGPTLPVSMTSFGKALKRLAGLELTRSHGRRFVRRTGDVKLR